MREEQGKKVTGPGRWKKGGQRYSSEDRKGFDKYREQPGFRNGAKVRRK